MTPSPILDRLRHVRRIARRRLLLFGLFAVLAGGIAAFYTMLLVDWLVLLPPFLRMLAGLFFTSGFVVASVHWVLTPLRAPLTLEELAGKMESSFPAMKDQLSSSVNFLERGETQTSSMARHVVETTQQELEHIPLEDALVGGPVTRRALALCVALLLLMLTATFSPDWLRIGSRRYLHPSGGVQWPTRVSILPQSGDQTIALGDAMNVRLQVERGWSEDLRVVVHYRESDGGTGTLALRHEGDGRYSASLEAVTNDLTYWFEAGDASTQDHPAAVRVVPRPEIIEALALVERPPYAADAPARVVDFRDGAVQAAMGGFITVRLKVSKSLARAKPEMLGLQSDDGSWYPLVVDEQEPDTLSARWAIASSMQLSPQIQDEFGFPNRGAANYLVHAVPDAPPTLAILAPPPVCEATASATLRVVIRGEDDFGIESIHLVLDRPESEPVTLPVTITAQALTSESRMQVVGTHSLALASLSPAPGDVLSCKAVARDNYRGGDLEGQETVSAEMRIKIVSDADFTSRIRETLAALEEKLRRTAFDQAALNDDTAALRAAVQAGTPLSDAQRSALSGLSFAQLRIARQIRETAIRLDDIAHRVEQNAPASGQLPRVIQLGEGLRSIAAGSMAAASSSLIQVREAAAPGMVQSALSDAVQSQQKALKELRDVLRSMGQWGSFQGVVARTQDLLDRQGRVRRDTGELAKSALGKPLEALNAEERSELNEVQRAQEQLVDDVVEHLARLEQMRQSVADKDRMAAESLDAALRAARAEDLTRHVREAAAAIAANRSGAADAEQKAASRALQKMLAQLHAREKRELVQLRKELDDAATQVAELIEEQQALRNQATALDAPSETELDQIADTQGTLARNAKMLGGDLAEGESTADAGQLVRLSATPMGKSEDELLAGDAGASLEAQEEALRLLHEAREILLAADQKAAEEILRRTLADIQQELQEVLAVQQAINGTMAVLRDALRGEGRLSRVQMRDSAKLAKDQQDIQGRVASLLPDIEQAAVYRWALERVGTWMRENHDAIDAREFDDTTVAAAVRIAHELENLIEALVKTQTMPLDTEFTESEPSGGGAGEGASAPPLPSLTELLVLKTMQDDINSRTTALYTRYDTQNPNEGSLRELITLGEDQLQVQTLAQMVADRIHRR